MHISIWQRWASNHSGSITIVGNFESPAKATEAAATIDGIIKDLIEWHQRPENDDLNMLPWDAPPTLIELELIHKYGLKADRHFRFGEVSADVTAIDRMAVVDIGNIMDEPPALLKSLLERLDSQNVAASCIAEGEYITAIMVSLTCNAPDVDTASSIYKAVEKHLEEIQRTSSVAPWGSVLWQGSVTLDRQRLTFSDLGFGVFGQGFPGMLDYLKGKRCTDIQYVLRQEK